ncbi:MAG TPA: sterol carrier protein domain-containing protein, partial [Actinomycetota bacterium]|nr:sterol carrier protein domain-containing protein [Actinomycetota bacterium]
LVEEQRVRPVWSFRWMLRLLDVVGALSGRGYPLVSEELVLSVEDALFPENRGPWKVVADGSGSVSVSPAPAPAPAPASGRVRPISIGTLSAIYSGSLPAADAVTFGLVDPALAPALASLFGGPAPWMYDFF